MNRVMLCAGIALLLATARPACAQSGTILRGSITSADNGAPLGFSIVTLTPTAGRRFTDATGAFAFQVAPGTYLLSVRHVGYAPLDTQVVVGAEGATVALTIRHLAIELPPVSITTALCTKPGRPDSSDSALLAVFGQLEENARRLELLTDSYPFRYRRERTERTVNQRGDTGRPYVSSLYFSSSDYHPYAVGRVIEPGWGPWGSNTLVIHSADLLHFSNEQFIASHCFRLAGRDTINGQVLVRVDFEPGVRIWSADMAGSAYLDTLTYELRYTDTRITHPERSALTGVKAVTFRTRFRNIAPGVPHEESETVVTTHRFNRTVRIATHRVLDVRFTRAPPQPALAPPDDESGQPTCAAERDGGI